MMRRWPGIVVGAGLLFGAAPAAAVCEPARPMGNLTSLPETWRNELNALVSATADEGQPWGCPGALVALSLDDEGATLHVDRRGAQTMARHVASPLEVVPMGKAMLAQTVAAAPPPEPDGRAERILEKVAADAVAHEPQPARGYVDASGTVRYLGNSRLLVAGGGVRGTLPVDDFRVALAARYTELVNALGFADADPGLSTLAVSGIVGYQLVDDPVQLTVGSSGTVALVSQAAEGPDPEGDADDAERSTVDGRMGTEVRLAIPLVSIVDFLVSLDAELAPGSIDRVLDPILPAVPAYTVGMNAGVQVRIP